MYIPNKEEFIKGVQEFERHEKRDAMYKVAIFLVNHFWGNFSQMADGLGVLLLTWNQTFYRYGIFNFDKLEKCLKDNIEKIKQFKDKKIQNFADRDEEDIKTIFAKFLDALQISEGKMKGRKSPVSVAKALHILAPDFFPLWDDKIARAYKCYYNENPTQKYILFCKITKDIADKVRNYMARQNKTIVKLIDEYNYSKYTKKWI